MPERISVAVASRSFSSHPQLREELQRRYETVSFNESGVNLNGEKLIPFLRGHSHAIVALERVDEAILEQLPELKVISKYGVGLDNLDLKAIARHDILLGWTGGVNKRSVSELALGFMLICLRKIVELDNDLRAGRWLAKPGSLLSGKTVGIVGCGHVGKDLVALLAPFGCQVLFFDRLTFDDFATRSGALQVPLEELMAKSDVVTIHLPCTSATRNFFGTAKLSLMKSNSVLINTARGGIVDELALLPLLKDRRIGAAAFDVFEREPQTDSPLFQLPNFVSTPHIGGSAAEAILAMGRAAIEGLGAPKPAAEWIVELGLES